MINVSPTKTLEINQGNIFCTLANINFNTINSSIAFLWVINQEFYLNVARLSENLFCLNIKDLTMIITSDNDKVVQVDIVKNIYCIQYYLPNFRFISKNNINEFLHKTLFIANDLYWWQRMESMKDSVNAVSVSGVVTINVT